MRLRILGVLLALVVATAATTAKANLITNGTFDTDLSGWTIEGTTTTGVTWDSGTAHLGRPGPNGRADFSQTIDVPLGTDGLQVSFDYQWQVDMPAIADVFTVELVHQTTSGPTATLLLTQSSSIATFGATVAFTTFVALNDLVAPPSNATLRFSLVENNARVGTRIQLDNVEILAQDLPGPAAFPVLALGMAALGLAGLRRRARMPS